MTSDPTLLDKAHWSQTTWGEIVEKYPQATVPQRGQDLERPEDWPGLDTPSQPAVAGSAKQPATAPRWGDNAAW